MGNIQGKQLKVSAIKNGTAIDHIPCENLFQVISTLKLDSIPSQITFGTNLESKKIGKKAIIKITDKFFEEDEINKIAILAPLARLSIIKDYEVIEKKDVNLPSMITGITKCFNPMCITNHQKITQKFKVISGNPVSLQCVYCEKTTDENTFNLL